MQIRGLVRCLGLHHEMTHGTIVCVRCPLREI